MRRPRLVQLSLALGLLIGCSTATEPDDGARFAPLAGSWRMDECTTIQTAFPFTMGICRAGARLLVDSSGHFGYQEAYLPGEDPPPVFPGRFRQQAGAVLAAYGLGWEVQIFQNQAMQWSARGAAVFPPAEREVAAQITQIWRRLPDAPAPGAR